jgi:Holliday junction resolvase RusA-like endonuclease
MVKDKIKFVVIGEPVAQGRPRFSSKSGFVRAYDPEKSRKYKDYVRRVAQEYAPREPLQGQLQVEIDVYKSCLKSFSKKKIEQAENKELRPTTKPDVDNYAKGIKDALNGLVWRDDSQVVDLRVQKFYSKSPRVEVRVKEMRK